MNLLKKLIIYVPKKHLLYIAAVVWGFAAYRVLDIGFSDVFNYTKLYLLYIIIALIGFYFFFKYVFLKVLRRNIVRIVNEQKEKLAILAFFDRKGYLTMVFMITLGVVLRKSGIIAPLFLGTFYLTIGFSLLCGAISFLYSGLKYETFKIKYLEEND